ncbi:gtp cyclohydrolase-2 [Moniliophthora roreri]|nr:gtp cyclohydrolase-2 [Moniliophthora roreri]
MTAPRPGIVFCGESGDEDEIVRGCDISLMASSNCSPQSHRILPTVSPVKHSEWIRMRGEGISVWELDELCVAGVNGDDGRWVEDDSLPT